MKTWRIWPVCLALAACSPPPISGQADDGETFTGLALQTGFYDISGTFQLRGNRGTNCMGLFVYEGMVAPTAGKATYQCTNGETGEAALTRNTGEGYIGSRRISFSWGR